MNILMITNLYPAFLNQSKLESTYAVHYFAREWAKNNNVNVIRIWPAYSNIFKFLKKARIVNRYAFEDNFTLDGVKVIRIPIMKTPKIDYSDENIRIVGEKIIDIINNENNESFIPDVVICDILNPSIYIGKIVAKEFKSKLVASLHNSDLLYLEKVKNYKKYMRIDPLIDKIAFHSDKVERHFMKIYDGNKNENNFLKILFGVEKQYIIEQNKLNRKILKPKKIIMIAASLKKLKKVNILIEAFSKIENKDGYVLKIIGDGPERKILENLVDNLKCRDCIFLLGAKSREEVLSFMEESDIFAMVSSPETFGLVYIEAMAKGCLTIGTRGEGIDGVIINNKNGFLCNPDSISELSYILEKVINISLLEKRIIVNNAIKTANNLNFENLSKKYLDNIYK